MSYHHQSGAQKRREKAMRAEGVRGQNTLKQYGLDVSDSFDEIRDNQGPVTVAEAERSFTVLKRIKNYLRSTMCQMRLTSLGTLAVESELAKQLEILNRNLRKQKSAQGCCRHSLELMICANCMFMFMFFFFKFALYITQMTNSIASIIH